MSDNHYRLLSTALKALDIRSLFGQFWDKKVDDICMFTGADSSVCQQVRDIKTRADDDWFGYDETAVR